MHNTTPTLHRFMQRTLRLGAAALLLTGAGLTACSDDGSDAAVAISVVSGSSQTGIVGTALVSPLVVKVTDEDGDAVQGASVTFATTTGGVLGSPTVTTNSEGRAQTTFVLGPTAGAQTVTATVAGVSTPATFTLTGTAAALQ